LDLCVSANILVCGDGNGKVDDVLSDLGINSCEGLRGSDLDMLAGFSSEATAGAIKRLEMY